jgi:hypothetical protein
MLQVLEECSSETLMNILYQKPATRMGGAKKDKEVMNYFTFCQMPELILKDIKRIKK